MEQDPAKLPPPRRSPVARLLAPLALVLAVVVLIMVFSSSLGSDDSDGGGDRGARSERNQSGGGGGGGGGGRGQGQRPPKRYEVQEGDSLSAIAERFDVPVEDIVELNPDVDPQALSTGEELKLR